MRARFRRKMLRTLLPSLLLGALACGPRHVEPEDQPVTCDPDLAAPSAAPALEVLRVASTGDYVPLVANDALHRQYGTQGGSHFYVYARVYSSDSSLWAIEAALTANDASVLASGHEEFEGCEAQWIRPREITVFIDGGGDLAGTLSVKAKSQQGAPLIFEAPVSVGGS